MLSLLLGASHKGFPSNNTVTIFVQVHVSCDVVVDPKTKLVIRQYCGLDFLYEGEHYTSVQQYYFLYVSFVLDEVSVKLYIHSV